jgi:hypothetical protein
MTTATAATLTRINLIVDFRVFFAVSTISTANSANTLYTPLAGASWHFNGSGLVSAGTWTPLMGVTENGGMTFFGNLNEVPVTTGAPLNDLANPMVWTAQP